MVENGSLLHHLANALPAGLKLRVYHISTPPTPCSALYSAAPGHSEEHTFCESHFLSLALPSDGNADNEILVYAIEVLAFTTPRLTTIFISKADSSGFLHLLQRPDGSGSIIRTITTHFLDFLVRSRSEDTQLVLSLFARSQNQYLFPGSIENPEKHVLDDRQLIKWWCRTLDPIVRGDGSNNTSKISATRLAHLIVPGCDPNETRAFFPASARQDTPGHSPWLCSYPVQPLAGDANAPIRCLIPRLPDDPKARFLNDLDGENVDDQGNWRSVKSLEQFWELMSFRQECSAGRLVGFIWVVFEHELLPSPKIGLRGGDQGPSSLSTPESSLPTPAQSQMENSDTTSRSTADATDFDLLHLPASLPPPSSTAPRVLPRESCAEPAAEASEVQEQTSQNAQSVRSPWPEAARGELVLSADTYSSLLEYLLELDFTGQEQAATDTRNWIRKVASLADVSSWGRTLAGRCTTNGLSERATASNGQTGHVNVLMGARKKRKAESVDLSPQKARDSKTSATELPAATLSSSLIRKKPKT